MKKTWIQVKRDDLAKVSVSYNYSMIFIIFYYVYFKGGTINKCCVGSVAVCTTFYFLIKAILCF